MAETRLLPEAPGVIYFPEGVPGFESLREFVLLQEQDLLPLVFLVSPVEPRICLPVVPIQKISPDYDVRLGDEDRAVLGLAGGEHPKILCLAVVSLGDGSQPATANLLAPIVINLKNWTARQVVQADSSYPVAAEV